MYLPKHNIADVESLQELLTNLRAADLVTATPEGLFVTFLPLMYDEAVEPHGVLLGHVARKNDHWRLPTLGEAMVIVHGPESYISPNWYPSKRRHGRVVPTWNYLTAHIYGELRIHDNRAWLEAFVRRLTERHESGRPAPWGVDDAPRDYIEAELRAIVGVELVISRIEAKAKLGVNKPAAEVEGTIAGLRDDGEDALANLTAAASARRTARLERERLKGE